MTILFNSLAGAMCGRLGVGRLVPLSRTGWLTLLLGVLLLGAAQPARAATALITTNLSDVTNPQYDTTSLINFGTINVVNSQFSSFPSLFSTINTINYTNTIAGKFLGDLGFQLQFITNTSRFYADNIINQGIIQGESILLSATNLVNSGELRAGSSGVLQLEGNTVTLTRSVLSAAGASTSLNSTGYRSVSTNGTVTYQNPNSVTDIYWGAGTGNVMTAAFRSLLGLDLVALNSPFFGFFPPLAASPTHEVQELFGGSGVFSTSTDIFGSNFIPFVRTNRSGTNLNITVVLVQTNTANTNLTVDVRFLSFGGANSFQGNTPIVRFSTVGSDITTGAPYVNSLYFLDYLNTQTNSQLGANVQASSSRPGCYDLNRDSFYDFDFLPGFSLTTNESIFNISYYQPGSFALAFVTNNLYAAYQAAIGNASSAPGTPGYVSYLDDPTNFPGRVEINANSLELSQARIRADNFVSIRATNLVGSTGALIDAPFVQLFIANTNTTLSLTNFAPADVARPNGTLSFYSTTWTNSVTNTTPQLTLRYHVLMVDASQLSGITPVTIQELAARGTNVVINNTLNIGRAIQIDSPSVTFSQSSQLNLPSLFSTNLVSSNFPNCLFFTNFGAINVPYQCALGSDRTLPFMNFVNRGTLTANSISIRAQQFETSGTNLTRSQFQGTNGGGPISILAESAKFDGGTAGGLLSAGGSILLAGNDLKIRNHQINTAGTLILSPTNSLTDTGSVGTNRINVALGFNLTVKPASGDLLGTTIYTTAPFNRDVPHVWAGTDYGPVPAGYTNNAALGRLLIDTSNSVFSLNRLSFAGATTNNALYVDYLELAGTITNDVAAHLFIDTNMTIYFANSSMPVESLDGLLGGRLRWVKDYAGPNTGVDVRLPDGRTVKVNVAKLNSQTLDSDGDGVVNASDLSPFDGVIINSRVTFTNVPPLTAYVTWEAAAQTVYQVEVNTNLPTASWQLLSNFTNASTTNRIVTFSEALPAGSDQRFYRISYQP